MEFCQVQIQKHVLAYMHYFYTSCAATFRPAVCIVSQLASRALSLSMDCAVIGALAGALLDVGCPGVPLVHSCSLHPSTLKLFTIFS